MLYAVPWYWGTTEKNLKVLPKEAMGERNNDESVIYSFK